MERENSASGVAWTALVLAIIALILSWTAFNRAGQDLEEIVVEETEEVAEDVRDAADRAEDELDEEFVDENEPGDEVETDTSINVTN